MEFIKFSILGRRKGERIFKRTNETKYSYSTTYQSLPTYGDHREDRKEICLSI